MQRTRAERRHFRNKKINQRKAIYRNAWGITDEQRQMWFGRWSVDGRLSKSRVDGGKCEWDKEDKKRFLKKKYLTDQEAIEYSLVA